MTNVIPFPRRTVPPRTAEPAACKADEAPMPRVDLAPLIQMYAYWAAD
ncbi:MAG: hypothetical protein KF887_05635 [Paracoccaceae bacterium]|nr:MAG: hypothetical protein KF887_05635 [Paracoccaceae bacterium]